MKNQADPGIPRNLKSIENTINVTRCVKLTERMFDVI